MMKRGRVGSERVPNLVEPWTFDGVASKDCVPVPVSGWNRLTIDHFVREAAVPFSFSFRRNHIKRGWFEPRSGLETEKGIVVRGEYVLREQRGRDRSFSHGDRHEKAQYCFNEWAGDRQKGDAKNRNWKKTSRSHVKVGEFFLKNFQFKSIKKVFWELVKCF